MRIGRGASPPSASKKGSYTTFNVYSMFDFLRVYWFVWTYYCIVSCGLRYCTMRVNGFAMKVSWVANSLISNSASCCI